MPFEIALSSLKAASSAFRASIAEAGSVAIAVNFAELMEKLEGEY